MKVLVVPIAGRTVLLPKLNMPLPAEGRDVDFDAYWQRRMLDGDVTVTFPDQAPAATGPAIVPQPRDAQRRKS
jgi:hypothetical protein